MNNKLTTPSVQGVGKQLLNSCYCELYINFIVFKEDKSTNVYIYPLTESFYSSYINPLSYTRFINPCVEKYSLYHTYQTQEPCKPTVFNGLARLKK